MSDGNVSEIDASDDEDDLDTIPTFVPDNDPTEDTDLAQPEDSKLVGWVQYRRDQNELEQTWCSSGKNMHSASPMEPKESQKISHPPDVLRTKHRLHLPEMLTLATKNRRLQQISKNKVLSMQRLLVHPRKQELLNIHHELSLTAIVNTYVYSVSNGTPNIQQVLNLTDRGKVKGDVRGAQGRTLLFSEYLSVR
ncbi:hypothetical protein J6590_007690 [Homalodisca vitripennis]|nr:hypothetical protein J6590_007690 [Homalodisca vitripennis]